MKKWLSFGLIAILLTGCQQDLSAYATVFQNGKEVFVNQLSAIRQIAADHSETIEMLRQQFNLPPFTKESLPQYIKIAAQLAPINYKVKALLLVLDKLNVI